MIKKRCPQCFKVSEYGDVVKTIRICTCGYELESFPDENNDPDWVDAILTLLGILILVLAVLGCWKAYELIF